MDDGMRGKLVELRKAWLAALDEDRAEGLKPDYETGGTIVRRAAWRSSLMACVVDATLLLDGDPVPVHAIAAADYDAGRINGRR